MEFRVVNSLSQALVYTNNAFVRQIPNDYDYVSVRHGDRALVFRLMSTEVSEGLNSFNRSDLISFYPERVDSLRSLFFGGRNFRTHSKIFSGIITPRGKLPVRKKIDTI